jgi:hypothetical protein
MTCRSNTLLSMLTAALWTLTRPAPATAQNNCGDTIAWNDPQCQQISSGALDSQWTVVSRHGEYAQSETECNLPSAVAQASGAVTITSSATASTCGDFNAGGATRMTPASWPYSTGDIQFNTFHFSPNGSGGSTDCKGTCTITVVGRLPPNDAGLWPAFWLLGSNCQDSNKWSGDLGFDGCPNMGTGYTEIDMTECYLGGCGFHVYNENLINGCDASYPVWDTNQHTFKTEWTASSIKQYIDGTLITTCNQSLTAPMFFIAQIQTGGPGGTPDDSKLPASLTLSSVSITDANANVLFSDDFRGVTPPGGDAGITGGNDASTGTPPKSHGGCAIGGSDAGCALPLLVLVATRRRRAARRAGHDVLTIK